MSDDLKKGDEKSNIFRTVKDKDNPYVILNKGFLNDKSLSWGAKGLLAYMLSMPNHWVFYRKELIKHSKNGRDSFLKILKELKQSNYLKIIPKRNSAGKINGWVTNIYETPQTQLNEKEEQEPRIRETSIVDEHQNTGKPESGKTRIWENQNLENRPLVINDPSNDLTFTDNKDNISPPFLNENLKVGAKESHEKTKAQSVREIFEYWQVVLRHPMAILDTKREKAILNGIKLGYTIDELKKAIVGCSKSPFHMGQKPESKDRVKRDRLGLIFLDAEHIDQFIEFYDRPPIKQSEAKKQNLSASANALQIAKAGLLEDFHVASGSNQILLGEENASICQ